jgi:hypothetical protein
LEPQTSGIDIAVGESMRIPSAKSMGTPLLLASFMFGQSLISATVFAEETCEKLYADYLQKAKEALVDKKPEDAVAFLLKASAIAESCANSVRPPEGQSNQKTLALAPSRTSLYR